MGWLELATQALKAWNLTLEKADQIIAYFKKAEDAGWFEKNAEVFKPLIQGNTTQEEKQNAAKGIADQIHKL